VAASTTSPSMRGDDEGGAGMSDRPGLVGVLFGGPSPEHDVSILTGLQAARELESGPARSVVALYWAKDGSWYEVPVTSEARSFLEGPPSRRQAVQLVLGPEGGFVRPKGGRFSGRPEPIPLDVALVCCHGGPGEDGTLQGALDLAGIAYSGPGPSAAALGMDKLASYSLFVAAGLSVLPRRLLEPKTCLDDEDGPFIVKPRYGGSSIGIDVVADGATALARLSSNVHLRRGAVVEPYRPDLYDLQIAVRTWPDLSLSAIERPLKASSTGEILGYSDKYVGGEGMSAAPREVPAVLEAKLEEALRSAASSIARLVGVRGVARVDFLSDGEQLFVNEVNTIPGSLGRHLFVSPPLAFGELLEGMLIEGRERPATQFSSAGADGVVLRGAGSIAAKLS